MPLDLIERVYVSQFGRPTFGLVTNVDGEPGDPDGQAVTVDVIRESDDTTLDTLNATRESEGTYTVTLSSSHTDETGPFTLRWDYVLDGSDEYHEHKLTIGQANPAYDELSDDLKAVVESVWHRFADLYDSPLGGPHFEVYPQSHFTRGRMGELMQHSLRKMNVVAQPQTTYRLYSHQKGKDFPVNQWGAVLEQGLYIEVIKHFIRSYVEQPLVNGVQNARLDRRDYMNRWQGVLAMEQDEYADMIEHFKIRHMMLGRPHVTVSGGAYGNFGPTRMTGFGGGRPRFQYRFH